MHPSQNLSATRHCIIFALNHYKVFNNYLQFTCRELNVFHPNCHVRASLKLRREISQTLTADYCNSKLYISSLNSTTTKSLKFSKLSILQTYILPRLCQNLGIINRSRININEILLYNSKACCCIDLTLRIYLTIQL